MALNIFGTDIPNTADINFNGTALKKIIAFGETVWEKVTTVDGSYFATENNKTNSTVTVSVPSTATSSSGNITNGQKGFLGVQTSTSYSLNVAGSAANTQGAEIKVTLPKTLYVNKIKFKAQNTNTTYYLIGYWNTNNEWVQLQEVTNANDVEIDVSESVNAIGIRSKHNPSATGTGNTNLNIYYLDISSWNE